MKHLEKFRTQLERALWSYILLVLATPFAFAQSIEGLNQLEGHKTKTYYSTGAKVHAETMAKRCDNVMSFYKPLINFEPTVTLLVLSPEDWSKYTKFPFYGMPHYNGGTLVVASEDNDFWKSFIPALDQLPKDLAHKITTTYSDENKTLTMRGFFDLLAIHELGHAFHNQGGLTMQRKWMGELFANILLHTYIAENEPQLLPALTLFPQMVIATTKKTDLKFTTLNELETNYDLLGQEYPVNYGWYQCRWHSAAGTIYDDGGTEAFVKLWDALKTQKDPVDDAAFAKILLEKVHRSVANVPLKWDE